MNASTAPTQFATSQIAQEVGNLDRSLALVIQRAKEARESIRKGHNVTGGFGTILSSAAQDVAKAEGKVGALLTLAAAMGVTEADLLAAYTGGVNTI